MYARRMIPSDIITQILCRLPSKSIGRFRSVSKEWQSLLTNPKFIETHQKTLNRNHHIFSDNEEHVLYSHPFDHHESYIKPTTKLLPIELTTMASDIGIKGSCNGLLLVSLSNEELVLLDPHTIDNSDMGGFEELVLLNPTTGEFVQLPQSVRDIPHERNNQESVQIKNTYGFGYDSVTDDYKVITLTSFVYYIGKLYILSGPEQVTRITLRVSVYSLKSNTWRQLMIVDNPDYDFRTSSRVVYANGFLHWVVKKNNIDPSNVIVAFSLADECFSEVPSPNCGNHTDIMSEKCCRLVALGGKLAIYKSPLSKWCGRNSDLWLMKEYGVKESWTKIPLDIFDDDLCMINLTIFDDNGKIRVASQKTKHMLIYDFERGNFSKDAYVWSWRFHLYGSYVESLVSPKRRLC